jgi:hypothetical protein
MPIAALLTATIQASVFALGFSLLTAVTAAKKVKQPASALIIFLGCL